MEKYKREKKNLVNSTKKSCTKEIFESIIGCKHPLIASGATPIESASRAPDEINTRITKLDRRDDSMFEPILEKTFDYSLGGYSHRERWSRTRQN
jgi:hypothetical protein